MMVGASMSLPYFLRQQIIALTVIYSTPNNKNLYCKLQEI